MGDRLLTGLLDHEVLLQRASATELRRLVKLVATGEIARLPVREHQEPFV